MVGPAGLPWGCKLVRLGEDLRQRRVVRRQVPEEVPAARQPQATPVSAEYCGRPACRNSGISIGVESLEAIPKHVETVTLLNSNLY